MGGRVEEINASYPYIHALFRELGAPRALTIPFVFSTWSSGRLWTLITSLIGSPQR